MCYFDSSSRSLTLTFKQWKPRQLRCLALFKCEVLFSVGLSF
jgi:hypothetical protein